MKHYYNPRTIGTRHNSYAQQESTFPQHKSTFTGAQHESSFTAFLAEILTGSTEVAEHPLQHESATAGLPLAGFEHDASALVSALQHKSGRYGDIIISRDTLYMKAAD